jgi:hypothetical protein
LQASYDRILRNVVKITLLDKGAMAGHQLWHGTGIVGRIHRKDAIGTKDGVVLVATRTALYNEFTARHCKVTFYDPVSHLPLRNTNQHNPLDPSVFTYVTPLYKEELKKLHDKDQKKMTHHDSMMLKQLTELSTLNASLDFSVNYLPETSRPKTYEERDGSSVDYNEFSAIDFCELNAELSGVSEDESEESEESEEEGAGYSFLMSSAVSGKNSKGELRRQKQLVKEKKKKEQEQRRKEREERAFKRQMYEDRKRQKKERRAKKEAERKSSILEQQMLLQRPPEDNDGSDDDDDDRDRDHKSEPPGPRSASKFSDDDDDITTVADSKTVDTFSSSVGESKRTNGLESDSGDSSDSNFDNWKPPAVEVGDELTIIQYPDTHDNEHPHTRKVKVYNITGSKIYYRIDPQLDTHRLLDGAVLVKLYEDELKYRVVGLHIGRCTEFKNKPISWCHHGFLLTHAFQRLRIDISKKVAHDVESVATEVKVASANFRKMSLLAAKQDLENLLSTSRTPVGSSRTINALAAIDSDRARDLLLNAEAAGIDAVITLMNMYYSDLDLQTMAMRVCVRMLLGTYLQHGKYLSQVEAIAQFGALGIVRHTVHVMHAFPDSTDLNVYALWLLALMSQNAINARAAGSEGANDAIVHALKNFAEFGKANADGQKWGAACVTNMARVPGNREKLEELGVREVIVQLIDNSPGVLADWACVVSVLGAVTELARKPHFASRNKLVDLKVQHTIREMQLRLEDELQEIKLKEKKRLKAEMDDESFESGSKDPMNMGDEGEMARKKFTEKENLYVQEAIDVCMDVLSFGIPPEIWKEAIERATRFEIDWDLVSAGLNLGYSNNKVDIKRAGQTFRKKSMLSKQNSMRSWTKRGTQPAGSPKQRKLVRGIDF